MSRLSDCMLYVIYVLGCIQVSSSKFLVNVIMFYSLRRCFAHLDNLVTIHLLYKSHYIEIGAGNDVKASLKCYLHSTYCTSQASC